MLANVLKSILHNLGVLLVGFVLGFIGLLIDVFFSIPRFHFIISDILGCLSLLAGFLIRVWATYYFYQKKMRVILLEPQKSLIITGPYAFSRNPLYLGGNIFIFFGAAFLLGSPSAIIISTIGIFATDYMIKREESHLRIHFGKQWSDYEKKVRRWL